MTSAEIRQCNQLFRGNTAYRRSVLIGRCLVQPQEMGVMRSLARRRPGFTGNTLELAILIAGSVAAEMNGVELALVPGDAAVLPATRKFRSHKPAEGLAVLRLPFQVHGKENESRRLLEELNRGILRIRYRLSGFDAITRRIMFATRRKPPYFDEQLRCLVEELLIELLRGILPELPQSGEDSQTRQHLRGGNPEKLIEAVKFYIHDNAHRFLRPSEVSGHFGLTLNHLNQICRKYEKRTLLKIIWESKISLACNHLTHSQQTVREISALLGIDDVNYFCHRFKQLTGCTPLEFRQGYERFSLR